MIPPAKRGVAQPFASAGIGTETSFRPRQSLHPSMMFTLSLPITRRRLVLVREAVGAVATLGLGCGILAALWSASGGVRSLLSPAQFAAYGIGVLSAALVAYGISAALAAVLDDLWQTYAALAIVAVLVFALPATRIWSAALPAGASAGAPLPLPGAILLALTATAALSLLSVRLVERREF
jgi:hypothetical protein